LTENTLLTFYITATASGSLQKTSKLSLVGFGDGTEGAHRGEGEHRGELKALGKKVQVPLMKLSKLEPMLETGGDVHVVMKLVKKVRECDVDCGPGREDRGVPHWGSVTDRYRFTQRLSISF